ncbi:hypothetical protein KY285_036331 [Solanum tuberosum]|nr:hypothetical protein KY285_036331 [Solanum tuberosum]
MNQTGTKKNDNRKDNSESFQGKADENQQNAGIDSILHFINYLSDLSDKEVMGGMDGGIQEETTNLQEGVSRGRKLSHVMHETLIDPRAPTTSKNVDPVSATKDDMLDTVEREEDIEGTPSEDPTISTSVNAPKQSSMQQRSTYQPTQNDGSKQQRQRKSPQMLNNKSTLALSKKNIDAIKKKQAMEEKRNVEMHQNVDYELVKEQVGSHAVPLQTKDDPCELVVNYEEEYDPDQLEEHEDDDETSAHLLKAFGSTMNSDCQDETTSNSEGRFIT